MEFVLDNSVAMRWMPIGRSSKDQTYATTVLESMLDTAAIVPNLWHLEATNVLLGAIRREEATVAEVERFTMQLENLPITVDSSTADQAFGRGMALATAYNLSSYDAAYLELAIRKSIPLATLDKKLSKAAKASDIDIYLAG